MSECRLRLPAGLDVDSFLRNYWQQRPLLLRQALPADAFTLTADELAGLACEPEVESRLIRQDAEGNWALRHGPFVEADFAGLPASGWTLLVQDVDKFEPAVEWLLEAFDFIPSWRIDDIMVSFASDQGGVGPHSDAYDVFLIQAAGQRRWRLSNRAYTEQDLIPDLELRVLKSFETDEEWLLEPGDVLYLPPGIAHWGVAEGDCMSYSLGLRAPSRRDLAAEWFGYLIENADELLLRDPPSLSSSDAARLPDTTISAARTLIDTLMTERNTDFANWLGLYLTEPKRQFEIHSRETPCSLPEIAALARAGTGLTRHPAARMAWSDTAARTLILFCHGDSWELPNETTSAVKMLSDKRRLDADDVIGLLASGEAIQALLLTLIDRGILTEDDE